MSLAINGDKSAFEDLVRRKQSWVRNLMRRLCGDAVEADDLSQQVFLQVWRKISGVQKPEAFDGWVKQIAINTWLQQVRRGAPVESDIDDVVSMATANSEGLIDDAQYLSEGEHYLQLEVTDSTGKIGTESIRLNVRPPNTPTSCSIVSPAFDSVFTQG